MALICITAWISKCVINSSLNQGAIWPSLSPWTVTNPILLTSSWNPVRACISNYLHIKLCNIMVRHWNLNIQCGLADQLKLGHGPLARKVKLRAAHAPEMPGTFPRHRELAIPTCIMARAWRMPGSLTSGFLWSRWRGKRSRHSRRMRNPQIYVAGMRPMG